MQSLEILERYFGYSAFRPGQEELITATLENRDTLGIMPTGAGKSLCFQVPALLKDGIAIVISPLISLMKDQVSALVASGVRAAFINTSLTDRQIQKAMTNACQGLYKIIYVAPERLMTNQFLDFARFVNISMITIDEAHCISQWGQDFRPSYLDIPAFVNSLGYRPPLSAFTATATPAVRDDIVERLGLSRPVVTITGFDRPNLRFQVQQPKSKLDALLAFLKSRKGLTGIIYCSTRKETESLTAKLREREYNALPYHAGLSNDERKANQEDFLYDRVNIIVATNAFGMGIDKSNVSYVVHYNMPKDLESYYQEAGRAGRDQSPADCLLLFSGRDIRTSMWLIENGESQDLTPALEQELRERNLARLATMAMYTEISSCLRAFILRYFGEEPSEHCGNCSNCNADYSEVDISHDAHTIIDFLGQVRSPMGVGTVISALQGVDKTKFMGLRRYNAFGSLQKPEGYLKQVISHLWIHGYITKEFDKFVTISIRKALPERLAMPFLAADNQSRAVERRAEHVNLALLDALKRLRLEIASRDGVPPFVVFADSTLIDMCLKLPKDENEMLNVSGVGKIKAERYGAAFCRIIAQSGATKEPTAIDKPQAKEEPVTVSRLADIINVALIQVGQKQLSGIAINNWLVAQGLMELVKNGNKTHKTPTPEGEDLGITSEIREIRGTMTPINLFNKAAQEFVIDAFVNQ